MLDLFQPTPEFGGRGAKQYLAVCRSPFLYREAERARNQGRLAPDVQVVKPRTRLPSDFDQIFEARGRDQRHTRAAPLQEAVSADGRAVDNVERSPRLGVALRRAGQATSTLKDGASRIVRS
jgi:hypothetical protein